MDDIDLFLLREFGMESEEGEEFSLSQDSMEQLSSSFGAEDAFLQALEMDALTQSLQEET